MKTINKTILALAVTAAFSAPAFALTLDDINQTTDQTPGYVEGSRKILPNGQEWYVTYRINNLETKFNNLQVGANPEYDQRIQAAKDLAVSAVQTSNEAKQYAGEVLIEATNAKLNSQTALNVANEAGVKNFEQDSRLNQVEVVAVDASNRAVEANLRNDKQDEYLTSHGERLADAETQIGDLTAGMDQVYGMAEDAQFVAYETSETLYNYTQMDQADSKAQWNSINALDGRVTQVEQKVDNIAAALAGQAAANAIPEITESENGSFGMGTAYFDGHAGLAAGANFRITPRTIGKVTVSGSPTDFGKTMIVGAGASYSW